MTERFSSSPVFSGSRLQLEICPGGCIYTREMDNYYKQGSFFPLPHTFHQTGCEMSISPSLESGSRVHTQLCA